MSACLKPMCWSAEVSFASFGVGTVANLMSFAYLTCVQSRAAPVVLYWQFTLLMQIPEGVVWTRLGAGEDVSSASRAAMFLNVLQPVALLGAVVLGYCKRKRPWFAVVAVLMYALLLVNDYDTLWALSNTIAPRDGCFHLNLRYWDGSRTTLYVVSSLLVFSAIPSIVWASVNAGIFTVTLLIAVVAYPCGGGSMWCWMISGAGLILCAFDVWVRVVYGGEASAILDATSFRCGARSRPA